MRISSVALLLLLACTSHAQSSQTPKGADVTKSDSAQSGNRSPQATDPAQATQPPITVVVQEPPEDPAAKARAEEREERSVHAAEQMVTLTRVLIAATAITLAVIGWQAWETRKAADNASIAAKAASNSATAAENTLATNREIERAYIVLTHKKVYISGEADGDGGEDSSKPTAIHVTIEMLNAGRTPGDLLGGYIGWRVGTKPGIPDAMRVINNITPAFLLPSKVVDFELEILEDNETLRRLVTSDERKGRDSLWLIGELDYADRFGEFHTAGYGRYFSPYNPHGPAFLFTRETGPFNYDRPMTQAKRNHYGVTEKKDQSKNRPYKVR